MTTTTKRPDGGELPSDLLKEFIAHQLSRREVDDDDETDRVIVHADCGFGETS